MSYRNLYGNLVINKNDLVPTRNEQDQRYFLIFDRKFRIKILLLKVKLIKCRNRN